MSVLRLLDAHTRSYAEVRPTCPGLLLVCAQVPGVTEAANLTGPRVLLLADLLTRAAEMGNLQVFYVLASEGQPTGQQPALELSVEALGIHPPAARASSAEAQAALGGPIDVYLASHDAPADDRLSGLVVPVALRARTGQPGRRQTYSPGTSPWRSGSRCCPSLSPASRPDRRDPDRSASDSRALAAPGGPMGGVAL